MSTQKSGREEVEIRAEHLPTFCPLSPGPVLALAAAAGGKAGSHQDEGPSEPACGTWGEMAAWRRHSGWDQEHKR